MPLVSRGSNGSRPLPLPPGRFSTDLGGGKANQILHPAVWRLSPPPGTRPRDDHDSLSKTRVSRRYSNCFVARVDYIYIYWAKSFDRSRRKEYAGITRGGKAASKGYKAASLLKADLRKLKPALRSTFRVARLDPSCLHTRSCIHPIQPLAKLDDVCLKSLPLSLSLSLRSFCRNRRSIPVPSQDSRNVKQMRLLVT